MSAPVEAAAYFAPSPTTERAKPCRVQCDKALTRFAYPSRNTVIVRDATKPAELVALFKGHTQPVTVARLSPDGMYCCSGDKSGQIYIWVMKKGEPLASRVVYETKMLAGQIMDCAWDGESARLIVSGEGRDSLAVPFARDGGNTIGQIVGHRDPISSCDFRKSRPFRIATGGADQLCCFHEGPPFKLKSTLSDEHKNVVTCVRFSPNDELVASVSGGKNVLLVDGKTGEKVRAVPTTHSGTILGCAWSPDSAQLATASADKSVRCISVADGAQAWASEFGKTIPNQQLGVFRTSEGWMATSYNGDIHPLSNDGAKGKPWIGHQRTALAAPLDGGKVLTVGGEGRVFVWNGPGDATCISPEDAFGADAYVNDAQLAPDASTVLLCTSGGVYTVDVASGGVTKVEGANADCVAFQPSGRGFVTLQKKSKKVEAWSEGAKTGEATVGFEALCLACSPTGTDVAVAGGKGSAGEAQVFALAGGVLSPTVAFKGQHLTPVQSVAFNAAGTQVATGDGNTRTIFVWDAKSADVLFGPLEYSKSAVLALAYHPSEEGTLASAGADGDMLVWDLPGKARTLCAGGKYHIEGMRRVAWTGPKGLVTAGADGSVCQWKL